MQDETAASEKFQIAKAPSGHYSSFRFELIASYFRWWMMQNAVYRVVMLQGPVGPFFGSLQDTLDASGWNTVRIILNSGDARYHGTGRSVYFSDGPDAWPDWLKSFLVNFNADVVLLFGDQRPMHRAAVAVAQSIGLRVVCFEEGYLRPEYVTMELGGNNAVSPLADWRPPRGEKPAFVPHPQPMPNNGFPATARFAAHYFIALRLGMLRFPRYRHHRPAALVRELAFWTRNAVRKWRRRVENLQAIHHIIEALDGCYFLVALQVHNDLQLSAHGRGWTVEKVIEAVLSSFARAAHPSSHLVFKGHPLDRGHSSAREIIRQLSEVHGVKGRVHYVDDGSLGLLSRHSRGMITVNSTSAMVSFSHAKPVLALGDTFYDALTANGADKSIKALDRFWRFTPQVDRAAWDAFSAHMIQNSLVNGNFYIESELGPTCARVKAKLEELLSNAMLAAPSPAEPELSADNDGQRLAAGRSSGG